MRSSSNIRHTLFSIENGTPQVDFALSGPRRSAYQKRMLTASPSVSPLVTNSKPEASGATFCRRLSKLKQPRPFNGSLRRYSIAGRTDELRDAKPEPLVPAEYGDAQCDGETDLTENIESSLISDETIPLTTAKKGDQPGGQIVLPSDKDYAGLGYSLRRTPKGTLISEFVNKGIIQTDVEYVKIEHGGVLCTLKCTVVETPEVVIVKARGSSDKQSSREAFRHLVSKLHLSGALRRLIDRGKPRLLKKLRLRMEDDLLVYMRRGLRDLRLAGDLAMTESREYQIQVPKTVDFSKPSTGNAQTRKARLVELDRWYQEDAKTLQTSKARKLTESLPINKNKKKVLGIVENNTYSIIAADTGSGKSTQVPMILLHNAIAKGAGPECRIICCQPRRVAAVSLAKQVAHERQDRDGKFIGYHVRFESRFPRQGGSITYCTSGILTQILQNSPSVLDSLSHIVLDEVHERDIQIDFLMLLLKRYIGQRQAMGAHVPKVVVMSASLDIDLFASYFQNRSSDGNLMPAPHITIPGRTFAVRKHYLQDVIDSLSRVYSADVLGSLLNEESEMKYYLDRCKVQLHTNLSKPKNQGSPREQEDSKKADSKSPSDILREEDSFVPLGLICAVIGYIFSTTKDGSILVFLPGIRYINAVTDFLRKDERLLGFDFSDEARFKVLHLHSSLPEGQVELLGSVPSGCRRIILSTDIAETSITVPDVKFVIDPGKSHQNVYDPQSRYNRLACSWISRSSAAQRAGRAGRVQEGEYFALFTKEMHESMRVDRTPEIVRSDLQSACLLAKKLADIPAREFLLGCIQPPPDSQVELAVRNLQALQALDEQGNITALGRLLSGLPFDPSLAKLVFLGIIFRCLDPLLIIASLGNEMTLMNLTPLPEQRKEALKIRQEYSRNTWSDHISNVNLFKATRDIFFQKGRRPAFEFAKSHFIKFTKFIEGLKVGQHVVTFLRINGHLPPSSSGDTIQFGSPELNMNSWRIPLIKSLLLHTLYPNLAAPLLVPKRYRTEKEEKVALDNTSVNSNLSIDSLLFFQRKKQSIFDGSFLMHDTSHVTPLATSLFGGRLQASDGRIYVDSWLDFKIKVSGGPMDIQHAAKVVIEFRKALDKALMAAFESLATSKRGSHAGKPMCFPNMPRDMIFNAISNTLIEVLDRDFDPEYTRKRVTAPAKWESLRMLSRS